MQKIVAPYLKVIELVSANPHVAFWLAIAAVAVAVRYF